MDKQIVALTYKNERERKILEWAENSGLVELADKINRARLESVGIISVGSQNSPWAVFESARAFFERLSERLAGRSK